MRHDDDQAARDRQRPAKVVSVMAEFLSDYGLWILLAGIFVAMHAFGAGCCGGSHNHGEKRKEGQDGKASGREAPDPAQAGANPTPSRPGGCH